MELISQKRVLFRKLKRFVELSEQIKNLQAELDLIKDEIRLKFAGGEIIEADGFKYGTDVRVRQTVDIDALERKLGSSVLDPFRYETAYEIVVVKPLAGALKSRT
jgi:hypothetical protein